MDVAVSEGGNESHFQPAGQFDPLQPHSIFGTQCQILLLGHTGCVPSVVFSPDGTRLASGSHDSTIRIWHLATKSCLQILTEHSGPVNSIAFSPDGLRLASASDDETVMIWELKDNQYECLQALRHPQTKAMRVAFSPNGGLLASGSDDGNIILWDLATGRGTWKLATKQGGSLLHGCLAFSPDGEVIASCSPDDPIIGYNIAARNRRYKLPAGIGRRVCRFAFSSDGQRLVSACHDVLMIWHMGEQPPALIAVFHVGGAGEICGEIAGVVFSPDSQFFASTSRTLGWTVEVREAELGSFIQIVEGGVDGRATSLAWSPDGERIASAFTDGSIKLWKRLAAVARR